MRRGLCLGLPRHRRHHTCTVPRREAGQLQTLNRMQDSGAIDHFFAAAATRPYQLSDADDEPQQQAQQGPRQQIVARPPRLLHWPGVACAAVLGELGWLPFLFELQRLQCGLFGRLATADALGARRGSTFKFALQQPGSSHVFCKRCGMLAFRLLVLVAFCLARVQGRLRGGVGMLCDPCFCNVLMQYRGELMALPSLAEYAVYQPLLHSGNNIHFSRLPSSLLREWTSARCGHHPFQDGRIARHVERDASDCLCGACSHLYFAACHS